MRLLIIAYCLTTFFTGYVYPQSPIPSVLGIGDTITEDVKDRIQDRIGISFFEDSQRTKVLILDFWATWCSPCVAMIPKIDSLQLQFKDQVRFLTVTPESQPVVDRFFSRYAVRYQLKSTLSSITVDTLLRRLFPHKYIPHYVWINQRGVVRAITGLEEVTGENIENMVANPGFTVKTKVDEHTPYHDDAPFLINGNGGDGSTMLYHSILTRYTPGLKGRLSWHMDSISGTRISIQNVSRLWLFKTAYSERFARWFDDRDIIIETASSRLTTSLSGDPYRDWLNEGNGFCYELILPPELNGAAMDVMRRDVELFFPEFSAVVEDREKSVLALVRIGGEINLSSTGGTPQASADPFGWKLQNNPIGVLLRRLNAMLYLSKEIVDETGYTGAIDMELDADLKDMVSVNRELSKLGLRLVEKETVRKVLIVRDAQTG